MRNVFLLLFLFPCLLFAQDDLMDEIDTEDEPQYAEAAFKGLKIVNFESTKLAGKKDFYFIVSHRFGSVKNGIEDLFGLDQAFTRLQFVYGISDGFNVGFSRSSLRKTYDGYIKYRLLRQKEEGFPFTVVGYNVMAIDTELDEDVFTELEFSNRLAFTHQLLISRKMSNKLSFQLMPTLLQENTTYSIFEADDMGEQVKVDEQENLQFIMGLGGRYKLAKRWSLNLDYGWHWNRVSGSPFNNPLSIGFDLETGGHVFQLHFSNAQSMNENLFLSRGNGDWGDGDFFFGFNLSRVW